MSHGKTLGKRLGQGVCATVYELTEDTVLRESDDETDGFRAVCWLSDEDRERFCLPKILEVDEEDYHWAVIERLYPVGGALFQELGHTDWDIINKHITCLVDVKNERLQALLDKAFELYRYVTDELEMPVLRLDLHHRNIMQRKDGTLVLSDPFHYLDI